MQQIRLTRAAARSAATGGRVPDVLAHGEADAHAQHVEHHRGVAGAEVARLVEDAVVGQEALVVDRLHPPVRHHGGGVVGSRRSSRGSPRSPRTVGDVGGDPVEGRAGRGRERRPQQQILGRVARDRELRDEHHIGARCVSCADPFAHPLGVAGDVTDGGVDLAERDPHVRIVSAA